MDLSKVIHDDFGFGCEQGRVYTLNDVWIRPAFGGKGRKMTGQLEAHANGLRYSTPKGETLDIMYRCALHPGLIMLSS